MTDQWKRRINSLRSGVWARWRSYSRRFSCLASSSAGVGSTRGFGFLAFGVAFREVFTAVHSFLPLHLVSDDGGSAVGLGGFPGKVQFARIVYGHPEAGGSAGHGCRHRRGRGAGQ